jgi:arginine deiminase
MNPNLAVVLAACLFGVSSRAADVAAPEGASASGAPTTVVQPALSISALPQSVVAPLGTAPTGTAALPQPISLSVPALAGVSAPAAAAPFAAAPARAAGNLIPSAIPSSPAAFRPAGAAAPVASAASANGALRSAAAPRDDSGAYFDGSRAAPMGSFHENDPARIIVMHEPGSELYSANGHPDSALFTSPVNWKRAVVEHANYRQALRAHGAEVYLVKDVMLEGTEDENGEPIPGPKLDALREFAGQFLKYDGRALSKEFATLQSYAGTLPEGLYKENVLKKLAEIKSKITPVGRNNYRKKMLGALNPESLVYLILNQPTYELHLQHRKGSGKESDAFYVGLDQTVRSKPLMNLFFSRDQQITTQKGVVIANPGFDQRKPEAKIMKFVFEKMGVPIVAEVNKGTLDGGDFIPVGDLVFQGEGLRTTDGAIRQLLSEDAYGAKEVAVVKDLHDHSMDRMHLDTIFNVLSDDKVLLLDDVLKDPKKRRVVDLYRRTSNKAPNSIGYYVKVEEDREFGSFLRERGFHIATVTHEEQLAYALNFLNVGNGHVVTPYGEEGYLDKIRDMGIDVEHVPMKCLTDGYGAAHCMTQVIRREPREKNAAAREAVEPLPAGLRLVGRLASAGAGRYNVYDARFGAQPAVVKVNATAEEASIQQAMSRLALPAKNVRVPKVFGVEPAAEEVGRRIDPDAKLDDKMWNKIVLKETVPRFVMAEEKLPDSYFPLRDVVPHLAEIPPLRSMRPIRAEDWSGLVGTVEYCHAHGLGFGDLGNLSNIRVRQRADGSTEFVLIDVGGGTKAGDPEVMAADRAAMTELRQTLIARGLLAPGAAVVPDLLE